MTQYKIQNDYKPATQSDDVVGQMLADMIRSHFKVYDNGNVFVCRRTGEVKHSPIREYQSTMSQYEKRGVYI